MRNTVTEDFAALDKRKRDKHQTVGWCESLLIFCRSKPKLCCAVSCTVWHCQSSVSVFLAAITECGQRLADSSPEFLGQGHHQPRTAAAASCTNMPMT
jgi:hypothetical protein